MTTLPNPVIDPRVITAPATLGGGGGGSGGGVKPDPSIAATGVDPPPQEMQNRQAKNISKFEFLDLLILSEPSDHHVEKGTNQRPASQVCSCS